MRPPLVVLRALFGLLCSGGCAWSAGPGFYRDVLPVLAKHCQRCHRTGGIGPMTLFTAEDAAGQREAMLRVLQERKMPPWFVDGSISPLANDPSLPVEGLAALKGWLEAGAPVGTKRDARAARQASVEWSIDAPDLIIGLPRPLVMGAGAEPSRHYAALPTRFTVDRWVRMVEVRPTNASLVKQVVVYVRGAGSTWLGDRGEGSPPILAVYTPGSGGHQWPAGMGKRIPAQSDLVLQVDLDRAASGTQEMTEVGMVLCKERPKQEVQTFEWRSGSGTRIRRDALLVRVLPVAPDGVAMNLELSGPAEGGAAQLLRLRAPEGRVRPGYRWQTPPLLRTGGLLAWRALDGEKAVPEITYMDVADSDLSQ